MLVYSYKGEKSLTSPSYQYSSKNYNALWNYNSHFFDINNYRVSEILAKHVYCSYFNLCQFNNTLVDTYEITEDFENKVSFVKDYLQENRDIKESVDIQCIKIYNKLEQWHNRLLENPNCLDDVKWGVVRLMKFYEKQGIYRVASINLKRNYYDFCL